MSEQTIFEACVDYVGQSPLEDGETPQQAVTRAVIQKLIELTPSPRTVDELTRILNGGGDDEVTEAKADPSAKSALCGEATGSYQPGFFERLQVLQLANGDPVVAEGAWAWLIKREPEQS